MISKEEAEELHYAEKVIYENVNWEWDGQKHVTTVRVDCVNRDDVLRLTAWRTDRRYTFSLLYRNAIVIRRWGDHPGHENPDGEEIDGPHKHEYQEGHDDDWAYPTDDVSTSNPRQAFFDFLDEESIELDSEATYQTAIGDVNG